MIGLCLVEFPKLILISCFGSISHCPKLQNALEHQALEDHMFLLSACQFNTCMVKLLLSNVEANRIPVPTTYIYIYDFQIASLTYQRLSSLRPQDLQSFMALELSGCPSRTLRHGSTTLFVDTWNLKPVFFSKNCE